MMSIWEIPIKRLKRLRKNNRNNWEINSIKILNEKILELQSQIIQTNREIDQLVYQLYGLTEEVIKILEESVG